MNNNIKQNRILLRKTVIAALFAAFAFVCFSYLRIEFPMFGGFTGKIYVGHAFVILCGMLLGPWYGAAAGAVGLTLSDLLAGYVTSAPPTFLSKFILGMAAGLFAAWLLRGRRGDRRASIGAVVAVSSLATLVNVVTEPIIRYFCYRTIAGYDHTVALFKSYNCAISMALSGVVCIVLVSLIYTLVQKQFRKLFE